MNHVPKYSNRAYAAVYGNVSVSRKRTKSHENSDIFGLCPDMENNKKEILE